MLAAEDRHDAAVRVVYRDAAQAADLAPSTLEARGARQQDDIGHGGERCSRNAGPNLDVAAALAGSDLDERPRHRLRPKLTVRTEDDASNPPAGGLELESGEASHSATVLPNVGPKKQLHGNLRSIKNTLSTTWIVLHVHAARNIVPAGTEERVRSC
jgi:hypothetical protein